VEVRFLKFSAEVAAVCVFTPVADRGKPVQNIVHCGCGAARREADRTTKRPGGLRISRAQDFHETEKGDAETGRLSD